MSTRRFIYRRTGADKLFHPKTDKAIDWFDDQRDKLDSIPDIRIHRAPDAQDNKHRVHGFFRPGDMFLYHYSPKTKMKYWDKYPLVIPWKFEGNGFIGLNFHYLGYAERLQLLQALYVFKTNNRFDEETRIVFTYRMLQSLTSARSYKACVKQYINSHVLSRFIKIHPAEWEIALMLPGEKFVGAHRNDAWADSRQLNYGV